MAVLFYPMCYFSFANQQINIGKSQKEEIFFVRIIRTIFNTSGNFLLSGMQGSQGPLLIRDAKRQCQCQDHLQLDPSLDLHHLILDLRRGQD
jgi:hypothetical protein